MDQDFLDRLVVFLAKRDGIDKLVKTFQYVSRLVHWKVQKSRPELARRAMVFSGHCGLSRKAFRLGRFLSGYNALRQTKYSNWIIAVLNIVGHSGDMVYFFFDHCTWLSRTGLIDPKFTSKFCYLSAYGEAVAYVAFIILELTYIRAEAAKEIQLQAHLLYLDRRRDQILMKLGIQKHSRFSPYATASISEDRSTTRQKLLDMPSNEISVLNAQDPMGCEKELGPLDEEIRVSRLAICGIQGQRLLRLLGIAANLADLVIAVAEIEPNPICNHPVVFGVSGLVSAWGGWYRNWPFQKN